jgi:hypothetical protein
MIELNPDGQFGSPWKALQRNAGLFENIAEFQADTFMTYARFEAGATVRLGDYPYKVAESSATDHHLENAADPPMKLYAQPINGSYFMPVQFGAPLNGVDDDGDAIAACIAYAQTNGFSVNLGSGEYRIEARTTPLLDFERTTLDGGSNRFSLIGEHPSVTRFDVVGDCTDFLFKVSGNTTGYSSENPRASWFKFASFSINGNGNYFDIFNFICADRCNIQDFSAFDFRGHAVKGEQWWDSECDARFVRGGDSPRLVYVTGAQAFSKGQTVTGTTSGATAWIMDVTSTRLDLTEISGTFLANEAITGATNGAATVAAADFLEGSEKAVIEFTHVFSERIFDSACNNIIFPATVQIEGYRWRALNWDQATRQNKFHGKIHWLIDRAYYGPAVYLNGGNSNDFNGAGTTHNSELGSVILVNGSASYISTGNKFTDCRIDGSIEFTGDNRYNVVSGNIFNNGADPCVILGGGEDNMIRDNMPRGSGQELLNTATDRDYALLDRIINERVNIGRDTPPGGWGPERLSVYDHTQDLLVRVASGDALASIQIADSNTTDDLRISAQGNLIVASTLANE